MIIDNKIYLIRFLIWGSLFFTASCSNVETAVGQPVKEPKEALIRKVVVSLGDTTIMHFINDEELYKEGWASLAQPLFWKNVMRLSPDSAIINIADNRQHMATIDFNQWMKQGEAEKELFKQNFCSSNNLDCQTNLFVTKGRRDFFEHRKSLQSISTAVKSFAENGVDPWYAETILLIESPGKNVQKSWAGAQGPFQLMRDVAVRYGLKVNKKIDQRINLEMSAVAASKLISRTCIPKVKNMLDSLNLSYRETDTWFRLLVLHAYHAGPGNLSCALYSIAPQKGGIELIQKLWRTECRSFKNESQNYSQLALAAHLSFNEIIEGDTVFLIQGDKKYNLYKKQSFINALSTQQIMECVNSYGEDLIDGIINAEYYIKCINKMKQELAIANTSNTSAERDYLTVSNELMRKRNVTDAIKLLRFTIEQYPNSAPAADSLSRAYKMSGNDVLAQKYERISTQLSKTNTQ